MTYWSNMRSSDFVHPLIFNETLLFGGARWRSWLRDWATSRKVAVSIPDCVIGIFHWHNPSGSTMTLGSTQVLTGMSTRNISWGKGCRWVWLKTLHHYVPSVLKYWNLSLLGTSGSVQASKAIALLFTFLLLFGSQLYFRHQENENN